MRWLVACLILGSGCSFSASSPECQRDQECASGELCVDLMCVAQRDFEDSGSTPDSDTAVIDMSTLADMGPADMQQSEPDMRQEPPDMRADAGAGATDLGTDMRSEVDMAMQQECRIDPFAITCVPDEYEPNGRSSRAHIVTRTTAGCDVGETFTAETTTLQAEICRGEEDWFEGVFETCLNRSVIFEVVVTPLVSCAASKWDVRVRNQTCAATNVQCETLSDGSRKITVTYPAAPDASIRRVQVLVEGDTDVRLPYELTAEFR